MREAKTACGDRECEEPDECERKDPEAGRDRMRDLVGTAGRHEAARVHDPHAATP